MTGGSVTLDADQPYTCPELSSLSISPQEIVSPQTASLGVQTVVVEGGTAGATMIQWSTTGGTFIDTNSPTSQLATPTFNCGAFTGIATVTVTLGATGGNNGVDAGDVCANTPNQMLSGKVVCDLGCLRTCVGSTPNFCETDAGGCGDCTNLAIDVNNCGTCGNVCPTSDVCSDGTCGAPSPEARIFGEMVETTTVGSATTRTPS